MRRWGQKHTLRRYLAQLSRVLSAYPINARLGLRGVREFSPKSGLTHTQKTPCHMVAVHTGKQLSASASALDKKLRGAISKLVKRGDVSGKIGESLLIPDAGGISADRVLLLGAGKSSGVSAANYRQLINSAANALKQHKLKSALSTLLEVKVLEHDELEWAMHEHVGLFAKASYKFVEHKSKPGSAPLSRLGLLVDNDQMSEARAALGAARALADGVQLARDLGNRAGNVCTPTHLAETAIALGEAHPSVAVTVLEESDMEALGMGSLLSVSQGSRQPAKLITMEYNGGNEGEIGRAHV